MRNVRAQKGDAEKEFERIEKKQSMRMHRQERTGKEHLQDNLKAKRGMRFSRKEGYIREFSRRSEGKLEEMFEWEKYYRIGHKQKKILENNKPDIVQKINDKMRILKESERKRTKKIEEGIWDYHGESGEWFWTGSGDPV